MHKIFFEWKPYMAIILCKNCFLFQVEKRKIVTETVVKGTVLVLVPQLEPHPICSWHYPLINYLGTNVAVQSSIIPILKYILKPFFTYFDSNTMFFVFVFYCKINMFRLFILSNTFHSGLNNLITCHKKYLHVLLENF